MNNHTFSPRFDWRLLTTIRCDILLQFRNGFYYVTAFVLSVWTVALTQVHLDVSTWLPGLVLGNLILSTFYFIGGLVLLEKGEGTLEAQVVTPLRDWEYLASKLLTLSLLSVIENVVIVIVLNGPGFNAFWLVLGIALAAMIYCLAGFIVIVRYESINEYLLPSMLYTALLGLPLVNYFGLWTSGLFYLHPLQAPLVLMQAAFQPVEGWQLVYGVIYSGLWIGILFRVSRRVFLRFVITPAGAR